MPKNIDIFDWNELAFSSKSVINGLKATFILAPRLISQERIKQIIKDNLKSGNIIFGIAKETHVLGFEGQAQFKMLTLDELRPIVERVNKASTKSKIAVLKYQQRDIKFVLEKIKIQKAMVVNGSYKHMFHTSQAFYQLVDKQVYFNLISAYANETEAVKYAEKFKLYKPDIKKLYAEAELFDEVSKLATNSFDYSFQIGALAAKKVGRKYKLLIGAFNKVVPYQTFAMLNGSVREKHFSPVNDLNYYDTVHAEIYLIIQALNQQTSLKGSEIFINLLPCPNCAKALSETDIKGVVYKFDHSDGAALPIFKAANKQVRQVVE